jgi:hypothetical protein
VTVLLCGTARIECDQQLDYYRVSLSNHRLSPYEGVEGRRGASHREQAQTLRIGVRDFSRRTRVALPPPLHVSQGHETTAEQLSQPMLLKSGANSRPVRKYRAFLSSCVVLVAAAARRGCFLLCPPTASRYERERKRMPTKNVGREGGGASVAALDRCQGCEERRVARRDCCPALAPAPENLASSSEEERRTPKARRSQPSTRTETTLLLSQLSFRASPATHESTAGGSGRRRRQRGRRPPNSHPDLLFQIPSQTGVGGGWRTNHLRTCIQLP